MNSETTDPLRVLARQIIDLANLPQAAEITLQQVEAALRLAQQGTREQIAEMITLLESATVTVEDRVRTLERLSRVDVHEKNCTVGMLRGARLNMTKVLVTLRSQEIPK